MPTPPRHHRRDRRRHIQSLAGNGAASLDFGSAAKEESDLGADAHPSRAAQPTYKLHFRASDEVQCNRVARVNAAEERWM